MKIFMLLACAVVLAFAAEALAFSTEQGPANTDGTAKFADPDERMPNFMAAPGQSMSGVAPLPRDSNQVTQPSMGEYDQGAAAFDHASDHLQNR